MPTAELANLYLTIGAGGLCIVVLTGLLIYLVVKILPALNHMTTSSEVTKQVIQNNSEVVKEMTRSNDNMTTALKLLDCSMTTMTKLMLSHDEKTDVIESMVIKIEDRTRREDK